MQLVDDLVTLVRQSVGDTARFVSHSVELAALKAKEDPEDIFAALRTIRPVFLVNGVAIVTRFDDVVEVLSRDADFSIEAYVSPMKAITGDFILGLNQGPAYERDVSLLRLAFRQRDVPGISQLVHKAAATAVEQGRLAGHMDVVPALCDVVPTVLTQRYLGIPGPDIPTLAAWARALFAEIFTNLTRDPLITEEALTVAAEVRPYVDQVVADRKRVLLTPDDAQDTVLDRLILQQRSSMEPFTDAEIRSNLIGMFTGMIPTTSKASALALDEILRHPKALTGARVAAQTGNQDLLWRYVSEAMRLAPQAPGLIRKTVRDVVIAEGTMHATRLPEGTTVFAALQSAMLDASIVDDPKEFRIDRPDNIYLHFGQGLHQCFGRYVNMASIPAIIGAVVAVDDVQRADGPAGELSIDGNYPTSMTLTFPA